MPCKWILGLFLFLVGCEKSHYFEQIEIIGHGATGLNNIHSFYHDNSTEAIAQALSTEGCNGIEVDVQLSKDGELWLFHDAELEKETNGSGCVPQLTSSELSSLNYSTVNREQIIRLADLDTLLLRNKILFLDLKHYNSCEDQLVSMNKVLEQLKLMQLNKSSTFKVHVIVSYESWIQPFLNEGFSVFFSGTGGEDTNELLQEYSQLEGVIVKNKETTQKDIESIRNKGKKVYIFEIRSPKGIRSAFNKYPDGVLTDDISATLIEKCR